LGEGGAVAPDEGITGAVWHERDTPSGCNPLIRPSGTFSQWEKVMELWQSYMNIEKCGLNRFRFSWTYNLASLRSGVTRPLMS